MHDDADGLGSMGNALRAVAEQGAVELPTLLRTVDRQTAEHGDRDWVRHVAPEGRAPVSTVISPNARAKCAR
jgi:hypothetical protein